MLMLSLLMIFLAVVGFGSFMIFTDYWALNTEVDVLMERVLDFTEVKLKLSEEVGRLVATEQAYAASLSTMQRELPSIEILTAIDRTLPEGVKLTGVTINENNVSLTGAANSEESVVRTTRGLLDSGVFSTAAVPVANRTGNDAEGIKFSLSLVPLPFGEVKK